MSARWAAVVVNYEAGEHLERAVGSLLADTSAGDPEVVVVDNGSADGSADACERQHPEITVVRTGANLGYARAANLGAAAATAPLLVVCNPDTETCPGTADAMVHRFELEADLGALGPRVDNPDGSPYPSARRVPSLGDAVGHGVLGLLHPDNAFTRRYRELDADPDVPREVDWVSGASIWLRRAALDDVGGWDEGYFMYVEDVDLCWRLRRRGWQVGYEPAGRVVHVQGVSAEHHPYRMIVEHHRSLARFAAKRWQGPRRAALVPAVGFLAGRALLASAHRALSRPAPPRLSDPGATGGNR